MGRTPKDVTETELAILEALWRHGHCTVRELVEELYPTATLSDLGTVKKLLARLVAKGCVTRDTRRRPHKYRAQISREELVSRRVQSMTKALGNQATFPLVMQLMSHGAFTPDEIKALRELVELLKEQTSLDGPPS